MLTLTEYMNKSIVFRKHLTNYCVLNNYKAQDTRNVLNVLDKIDNESNVNENFRMVFFNWLSNKGSTILLRELCNIVNVNYWENLKDSNLIDTFDSCSCYISNLKK